MSGPVVAADGVELSTFTSAIDLLRDVTGGREVVLVKIVAATTGATITGKTRGSRETARTYHVTQGDELAMAFRTIDSVSNVTTVRVDWLDN